MSDANADLDGLALNLRTARVERGMSQDRLAQMGGTSKSYINNLESGKIATPGAFKLYGIALALGLRLEDLMGVQLLEDTTKGRVRRRAH
jgi:transcriptional regulator with XRE-family HTH domain